MIYENLPIKIFRIAKNKHIEKIMKITEQHWKNGVISKQERKHISQVSIIIHLLIIRENCDETLKNIYI